MNGLAKLEWNILDSLSNDEETIGLILSVIKDDFPDISLREVARSVFALYQQGLIVEDNQKDVALKTLLGESPDYRNNVYWFGLTEIGYKYWEEYALTYSGEPIDWSKAWASHFDFKNQNGNIEGVSLEVCLQALDKIDTEKDWQVDRTTLVNLKIEGFKAKYYKQMKGGCRISFSLKKRN